MRHFIAFVAVLTGVSCARAQERALVHVPGSSVVIAIERVSPHAVLAEYDRTVTIEINGRPAARQTLFPDSGGYSRTNLYRLDAQHALLRDADASYTIDLASG